MEDTCPGAVIPTIPPPDVITEPILPPDKPVLGGWNVIDENDDSYETVMDIVDFYMESTGRTPGSLAFVGAAYQIVAGTNYRLTFYIGRSLNKCSVMVHSQPWTNTMEVVDDGCPGSTPVLPPVEPS